MNRIIITCEHAGNEVPEPYRHLFASAEAREMLHSHRGWDPGAAPLADTLARELNAPLYTTSISRLLVECNRSPGHPQLFSRFTKLLPEAEKQAILNQFYFPHRLSVEAWIAGQLAAGNKVYHIAVHSFTPVYDGKHRATHIGLLYHPARMQEALWCRKWQKALKEAWPEIQSHLNRPYRGWTDGFPTYLRTRFSESYTGTELEINQQLLQEKPAITARLLLETIKKSLFNI